MIWLADRDFTLYQGDAATELKNIESGTVDCCITSPPYYAQRDYGTGVWTGGDPDCDHSAARKRTRYDYSLDSSPIQASRAASLGTDATQSLYAPVCPSCGATRRDEQIGLEDTVGQYVSKLVEVFDEVYRVLKPEGTLWMNLGDKMEDKVLYGAPWLVAFALKDAGWILRRDIIWSKRNVMPESCKDRPTCSHEYLFLFAKQPNYYYDYEATLEPHTSERWGGPVAKGTDAWKGGTRIAERDGREYYPEGGKNLRSVWEFSTESLPDAHYAPYPQELVVRCITAACPIGGLVLDPFLGSGTTAYVARRMGRHSIGIELSKRYCELISRRTQQQSLFAGQEELCEETGSHRVGDDSGSTGVPGQIALPTRTT